MTYRCKLNVSIGQQVGYFSSYFSVLLRILLSLQALSNQHVVDKKCVNLAFNRFICQISMRRPCTIDTLGYKRQITIS
jgi:hypothetical protein